MVQSSNSPIYTDILFLNSPEYETFIFGIIAVFVSLLLYSRSFAHSNSRIALCGGKFAYILCQQLLMELVW